MVITDSPNSDFCSCGGVAYVGTIDEVGTNHDFYQPAWAFATGVGDGAHNLAEVASHESGHNVGLSHDGANPSTAYYAGHGMWAPIMGNSYGQPVTQWSRGEYTNANNTEDDYAVMGANTREPPVADEAGCAVAATDPLPAGRDQAGHDARTTATRSATTRRARAPTRSRPACRRSVPT